MHKIKAVRDVILRGWTQEAMARDSFGRHVGPENPHACKWCLKGACYKVSDDVYPLVLARIKEKYPQLTV